MPELTKAEFDKLYSRLIRDGAVIKKEIEDIDSERKILKEIVKQKVQNL